MKKLKYILDRHSLETIYKSFIRPKIEYGNVIYFGTSQLNLNKLLKFEKEAMVIMTSATNKCNSALMQIECGWIGFLKEKISNVCFFFS